jgi:peptide/nickel transport system substrate-binding protein
LALRPGIGTSLVSGDGGSTWTLTLHPNVRFSDGTPFDAEAVRFNWARLADVQHRAPAWPFAAAIDAMRVEDACTLHVDLRAPDPIWDQLVARHLSSVGSPSALTALGSAFSTKPVGAGPFLLRDWDVGRQTTLERNPGYWQKGKPHVDEIVVRHGIYDDVLRYRILERGQANVIVLEGGAQHLPDAKRSDRFDVLETPALGGGWAFGMNLTHFPFQDRRVRRAMALTLTSCEVVRRGRLGGEEVVIDTIDRLGTPFHDPAIRLPNPNVEEAQRLVDEVAAERGEPLRFRFTTFERPNLQRMADAIQEVLTSSLRNVEMEIELLFSPTDVARRYADRDFDATSLGVRWADPAVDLPNLFLSTSSMNHMGYVSPDVDAAARRLLGTSDLDAQRRAHRVILERVLDDVPIVWVARIETHLVTDKIVQDLQLFYDLRPLLADVTLVSVAT